MFDETAKFLHATAVDKGFWDVEVNDIFVTKQLMMVVSEAVEVMEAIRKDKGEQEVLDELADILIRTLDLYAGMREHGYVSGSLDDAFANKISFNKTRPEKHGVKF